MAKKQRNGRNIQIRNEAMSLYRRSLVALAIRVLGTVLNQSIKWGGITFLGYHGIPHLAGKVTSVTVDVPAGTGGSTGVPALDWLHGLLAALGLFLGWGWFLERLNRKHAIEIASERNRKLEKLIDPKRTSSGLAPDGTNPEEE